MEERDILVRDLYNKYAPNEFSEDKIKYVNDNYENTEDFIKDFYGKYAPDKYGDEIVSYISENYPDAFKKKEVTGQDSVKPQEQPTTPSNQNGADEAVVIKESPNVSEPIMGMEQVITPEVKESIDKSVEKSNLELERKINQKTYTPIEEIRGMVSELEGVNSELEKKSASSSNLQIRNDRKRLLEMKESMEKSIDLAMTNNKDIESFNSGAVYKTKSGQKLTNSEAKRFVTSNEALDRIEDGGDIGISVTNDKEMSSLIKNQKMAQETGYWTRLGRGTASVAKMITDGVKIKSAELASLVSDDPEFISNVLDVVSSGSAGGMVMKDYESKAAVKRAEERAKEGGISKSDAFLLEYASELKNTQESIRGVQYQRSEDLIDRAMSGDVTGFVGEAATLAVESSPFLGAAMLPVVGLPLIGASVQSDKYYEYRNAGLSKEESARLSSGSALIEVADGIITKGLFSKSLDISGATIKKLAGKSAMSQAEIVVLRKELGKALLNNFTVEPSTEFIQGTFGSAIDQYALDGSINWDKAGRDGLIEASAGLGTGAAMSTIPTMSYIYAEGNNRGKISRLEKAAFDELSSMSENPTAESVKNKQETAKIIVKEIIDESANLREKYVAATTEQRKELQDLSVEESRVQKQLDDKSITPDAASALNGRLEDVKSKKSKILSDIDKTIKEKQTPKTKQDGVQDEQTELQEVGQEATEKTVNEETTKEGEVLEPTTTESGAPQVQNQQENASPAPAEVLEAINQVGKLRSEEQSELLEAIPEAKDALTDGKVDREKITTEEGKAKFDEIYNKYDKSISPILDVTKAVEVGNKELADVSEGTTELSSNAVLFKGLGGKKAPNGARINAHEGAKGSFFSSDQTTAKDYERGEGMAAEGLPAGTTVEVVEVDPKGKKISDYRAEEVEAINNSDAQVVKLITRDGKIKAGQSSKQVQYVIKDSNLLSTKPAANRKWKSKTQKQIDKNLKGSQAEKKGFTTTQLLKMAEQQDKRGLKEGAKQEATKVKGFASRINEALKSIPKGLLTTTQSTQLARAAKGVRVDSDMKKFEKTATKIIEDVEYANKLKDRQKKETAAKKNIKSKLGQIANEVNAILNTSFPDKLQDTYDKFLESVGQRASIVKPDMDAMNELMSYVENNTYVSEDVDVDTDNQEVISDAELSDKQEAARVEQAASTYEVIQSISEDLKPSNFTERFKRDLVRLVKSLPVEFLETLSVSRIKNLEKEAGNVANGFMTNGFLYSIKSDYEGWAVKNNQSQAKSLLTDENSVKKILKSAEKIKKDLKTRLNHVSRAFGSIRNTAIYENFVSNISSAFTTATKSASVFEKNLNRKVNKALESRVGKLKSKTIGASQRAKYKLNVMLDLYLLEKQHQDNPNNEYTPSVDKMVETLKKNVLSGSNKLGLSEDEVSVIDELYGELKRDSDGNIDLNKMLSSMTSEEKLLLKFIQDSYEKSKDKYLELAFMRGESPEVRESYSHRRSAAMENSAKNADDYMNMATVYYKAGATNKLASKNPVVKFGAISAISKQNREMELDYALSRELRSYKAAIKYMKKDGFFNEQIVEALEQFMDNHVKDEFNTSVMPLTLGNRLANAIFGNVGVSLLIGGLRIIRDLPSNLLATVADIPTTIKIKRDKDTVKALSSVSIKDFRTMMEKFKSVQIDRVGQYTTDLESPTLGSRTGLDKASKGKRESIIEFMESNKLKRFGQLAAEGYYKMTDYFLPYAWGVTFFYNFKKITGKDFDFTKIENEDYLFENKDAINRSRARGDKHASDMYNTASSFEKGRREKTKNPWDRAVNFFMQSFSFNEYAVIWDGINSMANKGTMTKSEGTVKAFSAIMRMYLYTSIATATYELAKNGIPDDDDEWDALLKKMDVKSAGDIVSIMIMGNKAAWVKSIFSIGANEVQGAIERFSEKTLLKDGDTMFYGGDALSYRDTFRYLGGIGVVAKAAEELAKSTAKLVRAESMEERMELIKDAKFHNLILQSFSLAFGVPVVKDVIFFNRLKAAEKKEEVKKSKRKTDSSWNKF